MAEEYDRIYDANDYVEGFRIAVWAFDAFVSERKNKEFLKAVVAERNDMVVSDREAAAFMFAMERCELI
jgi:hypothetical protein